MSANQRRSGFRLPWVAESDEASEAQPAGDGARAPSNDQASASPGSAAAANGESATPGRSAAGDQAADARSTGARPSELTKPENPEPAAVTTPAREPAAVPAADAAPGAPHEPPNEFLRELITAMRKVADEARHDGVEKLKADADEAVRALEADAEKRRQEYRERAEADINGVGDWARAEAERIKAEAEQRVAARRAQLEHQLAAEGTRAEAETKALRARVADYERELEAYHAQLSEITDPAAFAAAAKRMPAPPQLTPRSTDALPPASAPTEPSAPAAPGTPAGAGASAAPEPAADKAPDAAPAPAAAAAEPAGATDDVHPAEEEVLAARLAELDETLDSEAGTPASADGTPVTTDVVVKGLGSFGAITGFRQALSGQPGISAVALSLGQTGEFVFRATHAPDVDVAAAITALEGESAKVEPQPEGGLRVTLERSR